MSAPNMTAPADLLASSRCSGRPSKASPSPSPRAGSTSSTTGTYAEHDELPPFRFAAPARQGRPPGDRGRASTPTTTAAPTKARRCALAREWGERRGLGEPLEASSERSGRSRPGHRRLQRCAATSCSSGSSPAAAPWSQASYVCPWADREAERSAREAIMASLQLRVRSRRNSPSFGPIARVARDRRSGRRSRRCGRWRSRRCGRRRRIPAGLRRVARGLLADGLVTRGGRLVACALRGASRFRPRCRRPRGAHHRLLDAHVASSTPGTRCARGSDRRAGPRRAGSSSPPRRAR
jgi:hypothetical protein